MAKDAKTMKRLINPTKMSLRILNHFTHLMVLLIYQTPSYELLGCLWHTMRNILEKRLSGKGRFCKYFYFSTATRGIYRY